MLTPQEIQEITLERAVFGGYDMRAVDDFLEPLTEDYITLYKENAVLKGKLRVLVEKLEEYRNQETTMKNAMVAAQKTCDTMVADAEKRCAQMLAEAEKNVRNKTENIDQAVTAEAERLERAKAVAADFIVTVEDTVKKHLELLASLKMMDLTPKEVPAAKKAYDYDAEKDEPLGADAIADEIESNLERLVGDELNDTKTMPPIREHRSVSDKTRKFDNLQFGKNFEL